MMSTPVTLFDYELPRELIAQHSVEPRDHSRLMVVNRATGVLQHKRFYEIVDELKRGDVLVMNNTKVFRARLEAFIESVSLRAPAKQSFDGEIASRKATWSPRDFTSSVDDGLPPRNDTSKKIELFLLRPRDGVWEALVKPGRHVHVGDTIRFGDVEGRVLEKGEIVLVKFSRSEKFVIDYANVHGQIPIPPYVHEMPDSLDQYQTIYAKEIGSVAAPTAGFHFTLELLEKIRAKGVEIHYVTLHVGLGTFRPMKSETIEEHEMHSEFVAINSTTAQAINHAKQEGRRVIAVGTTTVRTLEGIHRLCHPACPPKPWRRWEQREGSPNGQEILRRFAPQDDKNILPPEGFSGDVDLFITPGFDFKVVDALITNFHLPKSTLLVLVSAFAGAASRSSEGAKAGREHILAAYLEAIREHYRFFSFGDAMFIR